MRSLRTVSSLTGNAYTVIRKQHAYELKDVLADASCALPVVPPGGPYRCPFAENLRKAAICLTKSRTLPVVNVNYDLDNRQVWAHKKAFKHYTRQVCVCTDSHSSVECHPHLPRIDGKPIFIQESAHYHWPQRSREYNEKRCRICSNAVEGRGLSSRLIVSRNSRELIHCYIFLCLRCASLLSFWRWPHHWDGTCRGDTSLGQRQLYELDGADVSGIPEG